MGCNRTNSLGFLLLAATLSFAANGVAADVATEEGGSTTNRPSMAVDVRGNIEGTFMPYRYAFVTCGFERFTFLVPDSYKVDTSDPASVKLFSPDYKVIITVGLPADSATIGKIDSAGLRHRVLESYSDAVIKLEHALAANEQFAPALDFTWKAGEITRSSRTTLISTAAGAMEFTMTASPDKFAAGARELDLVIMTFRAGRNGKFDYVVGSKTP